MGYRDPDDFGESLDEIPGEEGFSSEGSSTNAESTPHEELTPERREALAHKQQRSRRSVEDYLEKKRLREQLGSVFDEDEEEDALDIEDKEEDDKA